MGGDLIPRSIEMAREIRRGQANHGPSALYEASSGRSDVYRHAMLEAGYVVLRSLGERAPAVCPVCGYDFGSDAPRRAIGDGRLPTALRREDMLPEEIEAVEHCLGRKLR